MSISILPYRALGLMLPENPTHGRWFAAAGAAVLYCLYTDLSFYILRPLRVYAAYCTAIACRSCVYVVAAFCCRQVVAVVIVGMIY